VKTLITELKAQMSPCTSDVVIGPTT